MTSAGESEDVKLQRETCKQFDAPFLATTPGMMVGLSRNVREGALPINGLRHPVEGATSGWFIWGGEEMSDAPDFFEPVHAGHLREICPAVLRYLGLPPGWRFLVDLNGYQDVWEDRSLLEI